MERRLGGTGLCWGWTGLWMSFPYPGTGFSLLHDRTDHLWIPTRLRWVVDQPVLKGLRPTGLLSGGTPCQPHPRSRPLRVLETETPLPPQFFIIACSPVLLRTRSSASCRCRPGAPDRL